MAELVGRGREAAEQEKRGLRMLARFDVMNLGGVWEDVIMIGCRGSHVVSSRSGNWQSE